MRKKSKGLLMCFIGMDGCGKTTHAANISEKIQSKGLNCKYIHHTYSLLNHMPSDLKTWIRDRFFPTATYDTMINNAPFRKSLKLKIIVTLLSFTAFIQALIGYIIECRPYRRHNLAIIYDRYFYDHLVHYLNSCPEWLIRFYIQLIPKPDATFLLDVPPKVACERKRDRSLKFYTRYRKLYLTLKEKLDQKELIVVSTNADINKVDSLIFKQVLKLLDRANSLKGA